MNWDTETDIKRLLKFAKPTNRKLRLFAVACCKEILHLITDQRSIDAVQAAELYADNKITAAELYIARNNAWDAYYAAAYAAAAALAAAYYATYGTYYVANTAYYVAKTNPNSNTKQLQILKDIINPYPTTLNPNTLTYNNNLIPKLAKSIYNSQNYTDLPILADILEDANEYNPLILNHLRSDQTHYKGCWVIDLLGELQ